MITFFYKIVLLRVRDIFVNEKLITLIHITSIVFIKPKG